MDLKKYKKKRIVPRGWKEITIGDVFRTSSGATPLSTEVSYYANGTIPWINSGELDNPYIYDTTNFISQKGFENSSTEIYPIDTVLVAMYGATAGKASILKMEACTNQAVCAILPNKEYSSIFLKYSIDTLYDHLVGLSSGSARDNLSQTELKKLKLIMPVTKREQDNIVSILSLIDRKIELNRLINQNLEAMAKQLYDYWFLQFDFPDENGRPYKSSGGKMVWNEKLKRDIPISWETKLIDDVAEIYNGATPSTMNELNYGGDIVWVTPKDLSDQKQKFVYKGERNISQVGYDSCSTHLLPLNTILMSSRAPIGLLAIAKTELCTNQGFKSFVPKSGNTTIYLYYYLQHHIRQIEQLGTGTTFKEVSREDILKFPMLKPSDNVLDLWEEMVSALNDRQLEIQKENESLTKQRDELLPLLMNGQVSVNSDLSVYKEKMRGNTPSFSLNLISDLQLLQRQSIIILSEKSFMNKFQTKGLVIFVVIILGAEVFVTVTWGVLLKESGKVFQIFLLVSFEVAAHNDDAPVGDTANAATVFPETDI